MCWRVVVAVLACGVTALFASPVWPLQRAAALQTARGPQSAANEQQKRALTLEDYYRMKSVGAPTISPDGQWVIYTVSQPVEESNGNRSETWLVRSDGSVPPERVQREGQNISGVRWGDDSRLRYTFQNATWVLEPARLGGPTSPAPATAPSPPSGLSPDGRWIVRAQAMPAQPQPPLPVLSDFERRHQERFRGDAFDWYPFRSDGQRFPLPERTARQASEVFLMPAGGGAARQLTQLGLQVGSVQWIPDGSGIVFTANDAILDHLSYGSTDIFRVTVDGELTRLTNDSYSYSGLGFSPDGRWMIYTRSVSTDMIIELKMNHGGSQDIFVAPAAGGTPVNITADWDLDPGSLQWSPDSRTLYITADVAGATHLFATAPTGGGVKQITTGDRRITGIDFDRDFKRMAYTVGTFDAPSDVYVSDIDGRNERRLTDVHAGFTAEVQLWSRPSERVNWESYDGTRVEGFLIYPYGYSASGGSYPLIVMNHGGPHAMSGYGFNFKNSLFAAHGYFVFLPNFRSSTGYGDAFKWGTWGAWGIKDGEDVLSGIDHLVARQPIDRNRVGTTGHSYGGIITNWLITRYPDRFRAAIPGAGESNWTSNFALSDISRTKETEFFGPPWDPRAREIMIAQSPALNCGGVKAATLFVHGAVDYRVPLEGAIQLYTCLKKQRVPAKMIIYEGQSHGISGHWNNVHRAMNELAWWEEHLKGGR
jgi:dipeptidyl aminopeptidase/acylaminoacyl peptidase